MMGSDERMETGEEGRLTETIEKQTSRLPSVLFLTAAGGAVLGSLALQIMNKRELSLFVGQWVPSILLLGLYNKVVKVAGHDRLSSSGAFSQTH